MISKWICDDWLFWCQANKYVCIPYTLQTMLFMTYCKSNLLMYGIWSFSCLYLFQDHHFKWNSILYCRLKSAWRLKNRALSLQNSISFINTCPGCPWTLVFNFFEDERFKNGDDVSVNGKFHENIKFNIFLQNRSNVHQVYPNSRAFKQKNNMKANVRAECVYENS